MDISFNFAWTLETFLGNAILFTGSSCWRLTAVRLREKTPSSLGLIDVPQAMRMFYGNYDVKRQSVHGDIC